MKLSDPSDELSSAMNATILLSSLSGNVGSDRGAKETSLVSIECSKSSDQDPFDRWTLIGKSRIDYGHCGPKINNTQRGEGGFYITTAINYTNGPGHMGHAYEATTADTIARYNRSKCSQSQTHFVTGSDEHGQKIANTAAGYDPPIKPIDLCDRFVTGFKVLNQRLLISNDDYIRTTSCRHKKTAKELWRRCAANDSGGKSDIYLSKYEGWYNVKEETFVTDSDAKLAHYKDPTSGAPLKKVEEESYFFRMGDYHDKLVQYINDNPEFIQPSQYRNNILSRLEKDRLRDLSISRTTIDWGIPVPDDFSAKHVMYVWFDALSNYLTGVNALGVNGKGEPQNLVQHWPTNVHIIGKDIIWFHTVIWPCILMSARLPLPRTVFAHGFVNDNEGRKMSKSIGNVVDPHSILDNYAVDSFRWYLCKEPPYGEDLSFSEESLAIIHNADLCDTIGNLIHRATNLCAKYCDGTVPNVPAPVHSVIDFDEIRNEFISKMDCFELDKGAAVAVQGFRDINRFLTEQAPWHMKGDEMARDRQIVVRALIEAVYAMSHLLLPFIPVGAKKIFKKLNTSPVQLTNINSHLRNLAIGTEISVGDILYSKIVPEDERLKVEEVAKKKVLSLVEAKHNKKEKKAAAAASSRATCSQNK